MSGIIQSSMDQTELDAANAVLATLGLSMPDYLQMCVRRLVQDQALPQGIYRPNAVTISAIEDARKGGGKTFNSVEALMADINSETCSHRI